MNVTDRMIENAEKLKVLDFREGRDGYFYVIESSAGAGTFHGISIWRHTGVFVCSCEQCVIRKEVCSHLVSALIDLCRRYGMELLKNTLKQYLFSMGRRIPRSPDRLRLKQAHFQV